MTGRTNTSKQEGASALHSRLSQTVFNRQVPGDLVRGVTIAFTAPDTITDSANGLAVFRVGQRIRIQGSTINDNAYVCKTVAAGTIVIQSVNGIGVKTQIAGPSISIQPDDFT